MPELPEVETTRRGIEPKIDRQTITKVVIRNPNLRWPVDATLPHKLTGLSILEVGRRGKYLLLKTEKGTLLVHLGMSGNLRVLPVGTQTQKHDHVDIEFDNGFLLRLNDPRRFGAVLWHDPKDGELDAHERLASLGPEPLSNEFNGTYLYHQSRNRKVAVKSFIMNSHIVVGAGNIYANESLFLSKIHPQTPAQQLTKAQCETLANHIKSVLTAAIEQGGTTLKDFLNADGKPGYFVQKLNVYGRDKQACPVCGTPIERIVLNQRASYFCPKCQPLKRRQSKK
ncbi:bifunctional DNA-formamidopyrimidine glycosylase/DNA-(apurinic or apyrimidinic site) lyase [Thiomicrorhabdus sp.]|uniref:bifunctional DNA-formamidopyrimidine glycosylase/DNA-(apurinic or apyrimidinic site) lyase n=1 Tax=Thiomicrorhabdus sp. TaxID=2039724 RepID=UPI0035676357